MNKPHPLRKQEILSKFEYANHRFQQLMNEMVEAKRQKRDPAFLAHSAAEIISTARECFDYLGQDIIECYVIPNTKNSKLLAKHAAGKLNTYFPYYESQLTKPDSVFLELKKISPALFQTLLDFTRSIASGLTVPNTLFTFQMLVDGKDMVNEKKHVKLIGVVPEGDQEFLIENERGAVLIPIKEQSGWSSFALVPGTPVSRVTEYRFANNNQEVAKFCLFSINATSTVISDIYQKHFA